MHKKVLKWNFWKINSLWYFYLLFWKINSLWYFYQYFL